MSAAKQRLNLFNFEFNYPIERHSPLWAGTRACPYILCFVLLKSALKSVELEIQIEFIRNAFSRSRAHAVRITAFLCFVIINPNP
jgi:hypothetical protein